MAAKTGGTSWVWVLALGLPLAFGFIAYTGYFAWPHPLDSLPSQSGAPTSAGQYFLVGDSRDNSLDSRFGEDVDGVGFVPAGNLCAVAVRVPSSPDRSHVWKAL